jgi:putative two-component system response regulator
MKSELLDTILIVDNDERVRRMTVRCLEEKGYQCTQAEDGVAALDALAIATVCLIIADMTMPDMSGLDLLQAAQLMQPDIAVILVTDAEHHDMAVEALVEGAYGYLSKPFQPSELLINVINALRRRELELFYDAHERRLDKMMRDRTAELRWREEELTLRLVTASEYRDEETPAHIRRMARYVTLLAEKIGWSPETVDDLRLAAPMHDLGKIGLPESIVMSRGKLTFEEFSQMKKHTLIGARILDGSSIPVIRMAHDITLCHHERWNGAGYPYGLTGESIPESARMVALADVYDALHTDRLYRPAFPEQEAVTIMLASREQFDPQLFACLLDCYDEFRQIRRELTDSTGVNCLDRERSLDAIRV